MTSDEKKEKIKLGQEKMNEWQRKLEHLQQNKGSMTEEEQKKAKAEIDALLAEVFKIMPKEYWPERRLC